MVDSGLLIDNIQLIAVPEPGTVLGVVVFAGAGYVLKRHQKLT